MLNPGMQRAVTGRICHLLASSAQLLTTSMLSSSALHVSKLHNSARPAHTKHELPTDCTPSFVARPERASLRQIHCKDLATAGQYSAGSVCEQVQPSKQKHHCCHSYYGTGPNMSSIATLMAVFSSPQNLGHVFQLGNSVFSEVEFGKVALELLTSVTWIQLLELMQYIAPGADLLGPIMHTWNRIAPANVKSILSSSATTQQSSICSAAKVQR